MSRLVVELLCFVVYFSVFAIAIASDSLAPYAIKAAIDEYFSKNVHEIEIINFGARIGHAQQRIDKFLSLGNHSMPMKVSRNTRKQPNRDWYILNASSILFFDSLKNYNQMKNDIAFQLGYIKYHPHLVYVPDASIQDLQFHPEYPHWKQKMGFLFNETLHSVDLATVFYHSMAKNCSVEVIKVINSFGRQEMKWKNSDFFVEKHKNFNKCYMFFGQDAKHNGAFWKIYQLFAYALNFRIVLYNEDSAESDFFTFYFGFFSNEFLKTTRFMNTYMIEMEQRKIYIPPGELYGDYEKMFLPFYTSAWVAIVLLVLFVVFAILAIKLKPPAIQRMIFGSNNRSPLMNFISILINGSQNTRLIENAPRICLAVFLFWSLIIR
jgi:hypothetical protein